MELNARFHRDPYDATGWEMLADVGIMIHMFDYWGAPHHEWRAGRQNIMSASFIHSRQHETGMPHRMPIYDTIPGLAGGMVLRPGASPMSCSGVDSCTKRDTDWCESPPSPKLTATFDEKMDRVVFIEDSVPTQDSALTDDTKIDWSHRVSLTSPAAYKHPYGGHMGCKWKPSDFGRWLEIQAIWQSARKEWEPNEFIVHGTDWEAMLPNIIEAFVITKGDPQEGLFARKVRSDFLHIMNMSETGIPLLRFDIQNWETPFSDASACYLHLPDSPATVSRECEQQLNA